MFFKKVTTFLKKVTTFFRTSRFSAFSEFYSPSFSTACPVRITGRVFWFNVSNVVLDEYLFVEATRKIHAVAVIDIV